MHEYGSGMEDRLPFHIPFLKSSIPFHSGIFHIQYRDFHSISFSIPYHALSTTQSHTGSPRTKLGQCNKATVGTNSIQVHRNPKKQN